MVILETAAIGAAGYGLWRGGEAATNKTKEAWNEHQRHQYRRERRNELTQKCKERKEKCAQLNLLRESGGRKGGVPPSSDLVASSTNATTRTPSSSVLDRMRADHGRASGTGGRLKTLFKKK